MTYKNFVKEIVALSKETERPLTENQVKMCLDLTKETVKDLLVNGDSLVIRDFVKFDTKVQKEKHIKHIKTGEIVVVPECIVPRVTLSENFKKEVKSAIK